MKRFYSVLLFAIILATNSNLFALGDDDVELVSSFTPIHEAGRCSVTGSCRKTTIFGSEPCVYNEAPRPLDDDEEARAALKSFCPMYFANDTDNPDVCCDVSQVIALKKSMSVPSQLLTRCQPCFSNFLEIWCAYTCDPNQSQFVDVTKVDRWKNHDGQYVQSANTMKVYFNQEFADNMYTSCKDVQFPGSNQKAMDLLCGTNVENCSPQVFLDYLGSKSNGQSPVQLNFVLVNESIPVPESKCFNKIIKIHYLV